MSVELEEATCKQVAEFLPKAIKKAFDSYYEYMESDWRAEEGKSFSKLFADHHAACKAALAHIDLLLKLGKMADVETRADHTHLALLRHTARVEANDFRAGVVPVNEANGDDNMG